MTTDSTTKPAKIGRPLNGDAPMTSAERVRRTRERKQASGIKEFQMQVQGVHLQYVEQMAARIETSTSAALRLILEAALDRYVVVVRRCDLMLENGATDEDVAQFMRTYWMPELPPMPEINGQ
jgi:hypothetical protein